MSALEKFLMKAKGAGKNFLHGAEELGPAGNMSKFGPNMGIDAARRSGGLGEKIDAAGSWLRENPKKAIAGAVGAGGAGALLADELGDDDDSLEGILNRGKKKLGGLADDAGEGIQDLLKRLGIG